MPIRTTRRQMLIALPLMLLALGAGATRATDAPHKVVIQISTEDLLSQTIAVNNAVNIQKHYGMDQVAIEVVAFGPGLTAMYKASPLAERISSLAQQSITFSACGNTIAKVEKESGKKVELTAGVGVVPAGVVRIMELQEQGYSYLRP